MSRNFGLSLRRLDCSEIWWFPTGPFRRRAVPSLDGLGSRSYGGQAAAGTAGPTRSTSEKCHVLGRQLRSLNFREETSPKRQRGTRPTTHPLDFAPSNPVGVWVCEFSSHPGCAARPWALLYNRFAVGRKAQLQNWRCGLVLERGRFSEKR